MKYLEVISFIGFGTSMVFLIFSILVRLDRIEKNITKLDVGTERGTVASKTSNKGETH